MRITVIVNLPVILALALGVAALPDNALDGSGSKEKHPLVQGPSHFSFSFLLRHPFLLNSLIGTNAPGPTNAP